MRILRYPWSGNLGDTLQSRVFEYYIRENHKEFEIDYVGRDFPISTSPSSLEKEFGKGKRDILLTGWLTQNPTRFLSIQRNLLGLIGVHLATQGSIAYGNLGLKHMFLSKTFCDEFTGYNITSRDFYTRDFLMERGMNAPFVGCVSSLISMIDLSFLPKQQDHEILFVDVDDQIQSHLLKGSNHDKRILNLTNRIDPVYGENQKEKKVDLLIASIQSSELIVTSRLHVALPSMALGKPTVLISGDDPRYGGLSSFLNIVSPSEVMRESNMNKLVEFANQVPNQKIDEMGKQVIFHLSKILQVSERESMEFLSADYECQVLSEVASELLNQTQAMQRDKDAVVNSRSWRLTSPLRRVIELQKLLRLR